MLYVIILAIIIYIVLVINRNRMGAIHDNKCHYFDKLEFSTQEFYTIVSGIIKEHQIPDVKISRVTFNQSHILSDKREYLRVRRAEDIFDICAAPFGTGFFVSYWHGEPKRRIRSLAMKAPLLNTALEGWEVTTYYKVDTASMFKAVVKNSITDAMEQITTSKGVRGLSEGERMAFTA